MDKDRFLFRLKGGVHPLNARHLNCIECNASLVEEDNSLRCTGCGACYHRNQFGFFVLTDLDIVTTDEDYSRAQEVNGKRIYKEYLKPYVLQGPSDKMLDVGCGIGQTVNSLIEDGFDAYGVDLPDLSRFWAREGNSPEHFFACDGTSLPFGEGMFDVTYSMGVIEHVGTVLGHYTLGSDYRLTRQRFIKEMMRVTKPGGRILIACPNKSFPLDIQHGARDDLTPSSAGNRIRSYIFDRTGVNIHPTWGRYHLLSYAECRKLFQDTGKMSSFRPLSLRGYFGFGRFKAGFLKPFANLANIYVDNLPRRLRPTFFNPYMIVEITKD